MLSYLLSNWKWKNAEYAFQFALDFSIQNLFKASPSARICEIKFVLQWFSVSFPRFSAQAARRVSKLKFYFLLSEYRQPNSVSYHLLSVYTHKICGEPRSESIFQPKKIPAFSGHTSTSNVVFRWQQCNLFLCSSYHLPLVRLVSTSINSLVTFGVSARRDRTHTH